ncbi:protein of unknown function DUF1080 [Chthoniobacter flavus Ellin428]|uniref:3-keto-alpha-glucoside-1,2-lyase/3-keto-2-hydroxy-glucal hydratase domain-containing protein n=1 Tax=Chthoniobacter flavus Ellin428 TaxID=497964 RepID=B4DAU6_9BACT|nr:DUF1080 domain-containing protein [Chthoniobacter flavus]EDY16418.1 protein of unknown function DUF1080 [Chthoniobacter flavus Ellin428]TCO84567.1 uncharacterized protein DUF1080 [Chthoniobacter flavus]
MIIPRLLSSCIVAAAALVLGASFLHAADAPPAGFTSLWNGKDLSDWFGWSTSDPRQLAAMTPEQRAEYNKESVEGGPAIKGDQQINKHWHVEGDEIVNDGKGLYLSTTKDYGDIELLVDYKMQPLGDSGIYLRGVPQVQIWDYTKEGGKWNLGADKGSGGLWNNDKGSPGKDPLVLADKPFGEWNHFRIIMVGSRVTVWLNDKLVVDHAILENYFDKKKPLDQRLPILPRGPIQLQTHGSEIRWRNLFVREIGSDEACKILASHGQEGFQSIFNGKDLDGWTANNGKGPMDMVKVEDGAMVWQEKKGGTPYWNTELKDFAARVDFKLPPGGNNGLAIRYPGTGNTAYDGMCECQVLDDNYEVNKEKIVGKPQPIDPRQAHGSAYGMVAAARGYQHPIGDWNFEEVTVKGSTIKVELNGTVILDTDLSKVDMDNVMAHSKHPGKDRTSGFFGFAGHNDPVQFKNVFIKQF